MITRGTTPTIEFTFKTISPKDMDVAYLTIKQKGITKIEKSIDEAIISVTSIEWSLKQDETLKLNDDFECSIQMRYRLNSGLADASPTYSVLPAQILKEGII